MDPGAIVPRVRAAVIGADDVAGEDLPSAAALEHDAVAAEVGHGQPSDEAASGAQGPAVGVSARAGAVQLDEQVIFAGASLAIAVDEHGSRDGGQLRRRADGLYAAAGDVEVDNNGAGSRIGLLYGGAQGAVDGTAHRLVVADAVGGRAVGVITRGVNGVGGGERLLAFQLET